MTVLLLPVVAQDNKISDEEITTAVETELMIHEDVPSMMIDVSTEDGIVMLEGTVPDILAGDRAKSIASAVKGVRGVVNELIVLAPDRPDDELKQDIEAALFRNPATESFEIDVKVNDSKVTLDGEVSSYQEKELAEYIVKGIKGITELENNVDFKVVDDRTDYEIYNDIVYALENDIRVDDGLVEVTVDDGHVTLSGTVGSLAEKSQATVLAWTTGVKSVNATDLQIKYWARDELLRKDKYVVKSEKEIKKAINDALTLNPRVNPAEIKVIVDTAGLVTLKGSVDNLKAKSSAENTTSNIVGVHVVKNLIKVRPVVPDDLTLEGEVSEAISRSPSLERYQIGINVIDGEVYLTGQVDSYFEKYEAEDVASNVYGVVNVRNNLEVRDYNLVQTRKYDYDYLDWDNELPSKYSLPVFKSGISDEDLKSAIKSQIWWSPFVDLEDIYIEVDQGVASLSGTVDTRSEREAAVKNAYEAGAKSVVNNIEVIY